MKAFIKCFLEIIFASTIMCIINKNHDQLIALNIFDFFFNHIDFEKHNVNNILDKVVKLY